jgi:hypothetical protein
METKTKKELQPGQVRGPYEKNKQWFYETVELGESCGFDVKEEAEKNIEAYTTWFKDKQVEATV